MLAGEEAETAPMVGSSLPTVLSSSPTVLLFRGCGSGSGTVWFPEIKKKRHRGCLYMDFKV